jgi:hypothetical protein
MMGRKKPIFLIRLERASITPSTRAILPLSGSIDAIYRLLDMSTLPPARAAKSRADPVLMY